MRRVCVRRGLFRVLRISSHVTGAQAQEQAQEKISARTESKSKINQEPEQDVSRKAQAQARTESKSACIQDQAHAATFTLKNTCHKRTSASFKLKGGRLPGPRPPRVVTPPPPPPLRHGFEACMGRAFLFWGSCFLQMKRRFVT
jgi:hypothetical protein